MSRIINGGCNSYATVVLQLTFLPGIQEFKNSQQNSCLSIVTNSCATLVLSSKLLFANSHQLFAPRKLSAITYLQNYLFSKSTNYFLVVCSLRVLCLQRYQWDVYYRKSVRTTASCAKTSSHSPRAQETAADYVSGHFTTCENSMVLIVRLVNIQCVY